MLYVYMYMYVPQNEQLIITKNNLKQRTCTYATCMYCTCIHVHILCTVHVRVNILHHA